MFEFGCVEFDFEHGQPFKSLSTHANEVADRAFFESVVTHHGFQPILDVTQFAFVVEGKPLLRLGDDFVRQPCRIGTPNQLDGLVAVKNGV